MTSHLFDPDRNPYLDFQDAIARAGREQKNVLLEIGGDWCIWCHRLEAFIQSHTTLAELRAGHYITVKVYFRYGEDTNVEFLHRLPEIDGVPYLLVYNGSGDLLCSQATDPFEDGQSYDYDRLLEFFVDWSDWRRSPDKKE
jgi:thioredoxin-related protein